MSIKNRYSTFVIALKQFIMLHIPLGSEIGLVFFADGVTSSTDSMWSLPDEETKIRLLESGILPDQPKPTNVSCVQCGIEEGMELLAKDTQNGLLVLLTSKPQVEETEELLYDLTRSRILLKVITVADEFLDDSSVRKLASTTGGSVTHIAGESSVTMLKNFYLTLAQITGANVIEATEITESVEVESTFLFVVDESTARDLTLLLSGLDFSVVDSPFDEDVSTITSPSGSSIKLQKQYYIPAWVYQVQVAEVGEYKFRTKFKRPTLHDVLFFAFGKPLESNVGLSVRAWINAANQLVSVEKPLKIFAEVTSGVHSIAKAEVVAIIYDPSGRFLESFPLLDTGHGDPDITLNDGIYSRYYTNFNSSGYYNVIINVNDKDSGSSLLFVSDADCCGSFVPESGREPIKSFSRVYGPVSIFVNEEYSSSENNPPPNRILDLRIMDIDFGRRTYTLMWTSAGEDYDHGSASSYRVKLFSERNEAKRRFDETGIALEYQREILIHAPISPYGGPQTFEVQLPDILDTGRYFVAVRAVDNASKVGLVSNVVEINFINYDRNVTLECDDTDDYEDNFSSTVHCDVLNILVVLLITLYSNDI